MITKFYITNWTLAFLYISNHGLTFFFCAWFSWWWNRVIFCNAPLYAKAGYFFNPTKGLPWPFSTFKLYNSMRGEKMWEGWQDFLFLPFLVCFLVVLRQELEIPGMGLISLLLTGGGCRTSFGGRVRQTGSPAALMRMPVIPKWPREERGHLRNIFVLTPSTTHIPP